MKKISIIVLSYVLLATIGFGGGFLLAKQKVASEVAGIALERVSLEIPEDIPENKTEITQEVAKEAERDQISLPQAGESLPEDKKNDGEKFSFAVLGDTQSFDPGKRGGLQLAVANIQKIDPDLVFAVGDLVSSCDKTAECEGKLNAWKKELGELVVKTYVVQGNHDRTGGEKADAAWKKVFEFLPTNGPEGFERFAYSLDFENAHFVVLASNKPENHDISSKQLDWLERDLARNKKDLPAGRQGNIFIFFHEPAYPTNSKIGESLDENPKNRNRLWNILIRYDVAAVFSGHEHIQSRRQVNGVYQFGFGNTESFNHLEPKKGMTEYFHIGQAFGMVEVDEKTVTVKTYSVDGRLLDSFSLPN